MIAGRIHGGRFHSRRMKVGQWFCIKEARLDRADSNDPRIPFGDRYFQLNAKCEYVKW